MPTAWRSIGHTVLYGRVGRLRLAGYSAVVLGILSPVVSLYISYSIIMGIKTMEERYGASLNADALKTTWIVLAVSNAAVYLFLWLPGMALVCLLASAVMAVGLLSSFNTSKKAELYHNCEAIMV